MKESVMWFYLATAIVFVAGFLIIVGDALGGFYCMSGAAVIVAVSAHARINETLAPTKALNKIKAEAAARAEEDYQLKKEWRER